MSRSAPLRTQPMAGLDAMITETIGTLTRAPWLMPATPVLGLDRAQVLVVGRDRVRDIVTDLLGRHGTQITWRQASELKGDDPANDTAHAIVIDGYSWEQGEVPAVFLSRWQKAKRPFLVLLLSTQQAQRGVWLAAGALDVFPSPAPVRRLTTRLMEAATSRRHPTPRRSLELAARVRFKGQTSDATLLELSPEDILLSAPTAIPGGRIAQLRFTPPGGTELCVFARSLFCRSYISQKAREEGRPPPHVIGLRLLGVTREESEQLDKLGAPHATPKVVLSSTATLRFA